MGEQDMRVCLQSIAYVLKNKLQLKALINPLEEECRKIEVFARDFPLCMILLKDVIDQLKHECEEKFELEEMELDNSVDEMDWTGYDQNWNTNYIDHSNNFINDFYEMKNDNAVCVESENSNEGFLVTEYEKNMQTSWTDFSAVISTPTDFTMSNGDDNQIRQKNRKARRCWSSELHRHFVATLHELDAATPKQIKKRMMVRGLKHNDVKIHLQKYKLHNRRMHNSLRFTSPQGTLQPT